MTDTPPSPASSSRWTRKRIGIVAVVAVIVVAGGTVGGVLASSGTKTRTVAATPSPTPTPSPTTTPSPTPSPTRTPAPAVNYFTGTGAPVKGPVVAVKIDDTGNGRPQRGIDKADIVYVEQAEGGLTRLLAVFDSSKPTVEAVRSTRASDPELLEQYGPVAFVASGGGGDSLQILDRSPLHSVINDRGGVGFQRDGGREAPYNLESDLTAVARAFPHAGAQKSIGWTFAAPAAAGSLLSSAPVAGGVSTKVGGTAVDFRYQNGKYRRYIDGTAQTAADGSPIQTANVIVQFCQVTVHPGDVDVEGNPSQYTHSIGSGAVAVFRNGHEIKGTWKRASAAAGTTLVASNGKQIPLAPGGAWVILVATGAPLSTG